MSDPQKSRQAEHQRKYRRGVKAELHDLRTRLDAIRVDLDRRFAGLLDVLGERQRQGGHRQ